MLATPESALAAHCGPVLVGEKPAALVSLPHHHCAAAAEILAALDGDFECLTLRSGRQTTLVLVYRRRMLDRVLSLPIPKTNLAALAYPVEVGLDAMLARLCQRLSMSRDFPHEVGFFLGYPQRDVLGFMRHRGRGYKLAGQWKVYGDVEHAKALFTRYRQCSDDLLARLEAGRGLATALHEMASGA